MKKVNKFLKFMIAAVMIFPVLTFFRMDTYADMGAPYVYSYDVIVTNPNGAEAKKGNETITIPNGTRLTISYDYTNQDDESYMITSYDDENFKSFTIRASDVDYAESEFDMSSISKSSSIAQYILTDESCLFKGPGERFGRNDDNYCLPANIVVSSIYHDDLWMYIEHDGHSGWIYYYNVYNKNPKTANLATDEWSKTFITTRNKIELRNTPYEDGEVVATINVEPLSEIPVTYYFSTGKFTSEVYIVYGQYSGWHLKNTANYDVAFRSKDYRDSGITIRETKVTEDVDSDLGAYTVPANTEFRVLYTSGNGSYNQGEDKSYVRISSGNTTREGWIDGKDYANDTIYQNDYQKKTFDYEQPIFDAVEGRESGTIEAGTYNTLYYYSIFTNDNIERKTDVETWYFISNEDGEKLGWIKSLSDKEIRELEEKRREELEELMANEEPEDLYTYPISSSDEWAKSTNDQIKNVMIWLVVGFGVIAATVITSLVVIKKKRENGNKSEKKDDTDGASDDNKVEEDAK